MDRVKTPRYHRLMHALEELYPVQSDGTRTRFLVCGSAPLAEIGLRDVGDLDVLVPDLHVNFERVEVLGSFWWMRGGRGKIELFQNLKKPSSGGYGAVSLSPFTNEELFAESWVNKEGFRILNYNQMIEIKKRAVYSWSKADNEVFKQKILKINDSIKDSE